jgi:hypothetical protein
MKLKSKASQKNWRKKHKKYARKLENKLVARTEALFAKRGDRVIAFQVWETIGPGSINKKALGRMVFSNYKHQPYPPSIIVEQEVQQWGAKPKG